MGEGTDTCFNQSAGVEAMNNSDASVGRWTCRTAANKEYTDTYLWQGDSPTKIQFPDRLLPKDINNHGQLLGLNTDSQNLVIIDGGSQTIVPQLFDGQLDSEAYINDLGEVVGTSLGAFPFPNNLRRSYLWLPSDNYGLPAGLNDLTVVLDLPSGQNVSRVYGINSSGQIAAAIFHESLNRVLNFILTPTVPNPAPPLVVNSLGDDVDVNPGDGLCATSSGDCTLRAAIMEANALEGFNEISFDIPETGTPPTIHVGSELPEVTDSVQIDGSLPLTDITVELDGSALVLGDGLVIRSGHSFVTDIMINNFPVNGITLLTGDVNLITRVLIGVGPEGIGARGNGGHGIFIFNSSYNIFGIQSTDPETPSSNIIANNGGAGIAVAGGESNEITFWNDIYSNGGLGIDLGPTGVTLNDSLDIDEGANDLQNYPIIDSVVTTTPTEGESSTVIWGSITSKPTSLYHINVFTSDECDQSGFGEGKNLIGIASVTTNSDGIATFFTNPVVGPFDPKKFLTATATDQNFNTSEFSPCLAKPLIVNSIADGVDLIPGDGACNTGNVTASGDPECTFRAAIMEANAHAGFDQIYFDIPGPDSTPTIHVKTELPVVTDSVLIDGLLRPTVNKVEIDGSALTLGDGLVMRGGHSILFDLLINNFPGNGLALLTKNINIVTGVFIGVGPDGIEPRGNGGNGIFIFNSSFNIFGTEDFSIIANNGGAGIAVAGGESNEITARNIIFDNGGLGIDLGPTGVTLNDSLDIDEGANGLVNYPFIDSVVTTTTTKSEAGTVIWGSISAKPNTSYLIYVFTSDSCDPSGFGEGKNIIVATTVTTDANGNAKYVTEPLSSPLDPEQFLTATARDPELNTSEFSPCWPKKKKLEFFDLFTGEALAERVFVISRVKYDPPDFTEDFIREDTSDERGMIDLTDLFSSRALSVGDSIKVSLKLRNGGEDSRKPSVTIDNGIFNKFTYGLEYDTLDGDTIQQVLLTHSTFGFNFRVAIEWDATREFIDSLRSGIRHLANYLYDVTDGQVQIDSVFIDEDQGRESFTYLGLDRRLRAAILMAADNSQNTVTYQSAGWGIMPRRFFKFGDGPNRSALENPTNPAHVDHVRELARSLGGLLFGFFREDNASLVGSGCDTRTELGFMAWPFPQFGDRGANSEMSGFLNYKNIACRKTFQYNSNRDSCWQFFRKRFVGFYGGDPNPVFAEIITPTNRALAEDVLYFRGPNDYDVTTGQINLQYDAGSRVTFVGDNVVSSAFDEFWTFTDADSKPMDGVKVYSAHIDPAFEVIQTIQGKTSDNGEIWLVGVNDGDLVSASGGEYIYIVGPGGESIPVERWVSGEAEITGPPGTSSRLGSPTLVMKPIAGDFPLIVSAVLDSSTFDYRMDVSQAFQSLPSIEYITDSFGLVTDTLALNALLYQTTVQSGYLQQGQIEVKAPDDSLNPFSFVTSYSLSGGVDSLSANTAVSSDASAQFTIDAVNAEIKQMLVVSSPFPIIRNNLNPKSIKSGQTHAISVYPAIPLAGENFLTMNYNESDFSGVTGAFTDAQFLKIYHWNGTLQQWELVESTADTDNHRVTAKIVETGVYAAFTTDIATDINDKPDEYLLPESYELKQNYPNPFNPATTISFDLPVASDVKLEIYNILGQLVSTVYEGRLSAGVHKYEWDGSTAASGVYLYRLTAGEYVESKKMLLLK